MPEQALVDLFTLHHVFIEHWLKILWHKIKNSTKAILVKAVLFSRCLSEHKHELNRHICQPIGGSSIKADRCSPLAQYQAHHKHHSITSILPIKICSNYHSTQTPFRPYCQPICVHIILCVASPARPGAASVDEGDPYCPRHCGSWKSMFDLPATW